MKRKNNAFVLMQYDAFSGSNAALYVSTSRVKVEIEKRRVERLAKENEWRGLHNSIIPTFVEI